MIVRIVGMGYVGKPLADLCASNGHTVTGVDLRPELCVGPQDAVPDVVVICVPTHRQDPCAHVREALRANVTPYPHALVIIESTVPIGSTDNLARDYPNEFCFSPERINPGQDLWHVGNTPKVCGPSARAEVFYQSLGIQVHQVSSNGAAEAAKILENSFRLVNISFAHWFAERVAASGLDPDEVVSAAASKPFGFMPFRHDVGVGGHCIAVDPFFLPDFVEAHDFHDHALRRAKVKIYQLLRSNKIPDAADGVIVVGAAYKTGVPDSRESPGLRIAEFLGCPIYDPACGYSDLPENLSDRIAILCHTGSVEALDILDQVCEVWCGRSAAIGVLKFLD